MVKEVLELPEKLKKLLDDLSRVEEELDERFQEEQVVEEDDMFWPEIWERGWHIWRRYYGQIASEINVVPGRYGVNGECTDTLLVIIEPSIWLFPPGECDPENRVKKRLDAALKQLSNCPNTVYIVFWAAVWDFRKWNYYKSKFSGKTALLKPWGMDHIRLI